ncbi:hypothetical protein SK128_013143 [Halocaridina rubra]|uniref:Uncharacterized protein n=1 Tax=Halocaridina rubra TaxID=373956 RepID=A0AAN8X3S3_HALRR
MTQTAQEYYEVGDSSEYDDDYYYYYENGDYEIQPLESVRPRPHIFSQEQQTNPASLALTANSGFPDNFPKSSMLRQRTPKRSPPRGAYFTPVPNYAGNEDLFSLPDFLHFDKDWSMKVETPKHSIPSSNPNLFISSVSQQLATFPATNTLFDHGNLYDKSLVQGGWNNSLSNSLNPNSFLKELNEYDYEVNQYNEAFEEPIYDYAVDETYTLAHDQKKLNYNLPAEPVNAFNNIKLTNDHRGLIPHRERLGNSYGIHNPVRGHVYPFKQFKVYPSTPEGISPEVNLSPDQIDNFARDHSNAYVQHSSHALKSSVKIPAYQQPTDLLSVTKIHARESPRMYKTTTAIPTYQYSTREKPHQESNQYRGVSEDQSYRSENIPYEYLVTPKKVSLRFEEEELPDDHTQDSPTPHSQMTFRKPAITFYSSEEADLSLEQKNMKLTAPQKNQYRFINSQNGIAEQLSESSPDAYHQYKQNTGDEKYNNYFIDPYLLPTNPFVSPRAFSGPNNDDTVQRSLTSTRLLPSRELLQYYNPEIGEDRAAYYPQEILRQYYLDSYTNYANLRRNSSLANIYRSNPYTVKYLGVQPKFMSTAGPNPPIPRLNPISDNKDDHSVNNSKKTFGHELYYENQASTAVPSHTSVSSSVTIAPDYMSTVGYHTTIVPGSVPDLSTYATENSAKVSSHSTLSEMNGTLREKNHEISTTDMSRPSVQKSLLELYPFKKPDPSRYFDGSRKLAISSHPTPLPMTHTTQYNIQSIEDISQPSIQAESENRYKSKISNNTSTVTRRRRPTVPRNYFSYRQSSQALKVPTTIASSLTDSKNSYSLLKENSSLAASNNTLRQLPNPVVTQRRESQTPNPNNFRTSRVLKRLRKPFTRRIRLSPKFTNPSTSLTSNFNFGEQFPVNHQIPDHNSFPTTPSYRNTSESSYFASNPMGNGSLAISVDSSQTPKIYLSPSKSTGNVVFHATEGEDSIDESSQKRIPLPLTTTPKTIVSTMKKAFSSLPHHELQYPVSPSTTTLAPSEETSSYSPLPIPTGGKKFLSGPLPGLPRRDLNDPTGVITTGPFPTQTVHIIPKAVKMMNTSFPFTQISKNPSFSVNQTSTVPFIFISNQGGPFIQSYFNKTYNLHKGSLEHSNHVSNFSGKAIFKRSSHFHPVETIQQSNIHEAPAYYKFSPHLSQSRYHLVRNSKTGEIMPQLQLTFNINVPIRHLRKNFQRHHHGTESGNPSREVYPKSETIQITGPTITTTISPYTLCLGEDNCNNLAEKDTQVYHGRNADGEGSYSTPVPKGSGLIQHPSSGVGSQKHINRQSFHQSLSSRNEGNMLHNIQNGYSSLSPMTRKIQGPSYKDLSHILPKPFRPVVRTRYLRRFTQRPRNLALHNHGNLPLKQLQEVIDTLSPDKVITRKFRMPVLPPRGNINFNNFPRNHGHNSHLNDNLGVTTVPPAREHSFSTEHGGIHQNQIENDHKGPPPIHRFRGYLPASSPHFRGNSDIPSLHHSPQQSLNNENVFAIQRNTPISQASPYRFKALTSTAKPVTDRLHQHHEPQHIITFHPSQSKEYLPYIATSRHGNKELNSNINPSIANSQNPLGENIRPQSRLQEYNTNYGSNQLPGQRNSDHDLYNKNHQGADEFHHYAGNSQGSETYSHNDQVADQLFPHSSDKYNENYRENVKSSIPLSHSIYSQINTPEVINSNRNAVTQIPNTSYHPPDTTTWPVHYHTQHPHHFHHSVHIETSEHPTTPVSFVHFRTPRPLTSAPVPLPAIYRNAHTDDAYLNNGKTHYDINFQDPLQNHFKVNSFQSPPALPEVSDKSVVAVTPKSDYGIRPPNRITTERPSHNTYTSNLPIFNITEVSIPSVESYFQTMNLFSHREPHHLEPHQSQFGSTNHQLHFKRHSEMPSQTHLSYSHSVHSSSPIQPAAQSTTSSPLIMSTLASSQISFPLDPSIKVDFRNNSNLQHMHFSESKIYNVDPNEYKESYPQPAVEDKEKYEGKGNETEVIQRHTTGASYLDLALKDNHDSKSVHELYSLGNVSPPVPSFIGLDAVQTLPGDSYLGLTSKNNHNIKSELELHSPGNVSLSVPGLIGLNAVQKLPERPSSADIATTISLQRRNRLKKIIRRRRLSTTAIPSTSEVPPSITVSPRPRKRGAHRKH